MSADNNFLFFNATATLKARFGSQPEKFYWKSGDMHYDFKGLEEYRLPSPPTWRRRWSSRRTDRAKADAVVAPINVRYRGAGALKIGLVARTLASGLSRLCMHQRRAPLYRAVRADPSPGAAFLAVFQPMKHWLISRQPEQNATPSPERDVAHSRNGSNLSPLRAFCCKGEDEK